MLSCTKVSLMLRTMIRRAYCCWSHEQDCDRGGILTIPQVWTWMNMTLRWTLYSYMYFRIHYIHIQFTSKPPLCCVLLSRTLIPTGPAQPSSLCFPPSPLLTKPKLLSPPYLSTQPISTSAQYSCVSRRARRVRSALDLR